MAAVEERWAEAFLTQARSDLDVYERLKNLSLPVCHQLHYLQMWLEKLCKAYLWWAAPASPSVPGFKASHNVVAKALPTLIVQQWHALGYAAQPNATEIRDICREIDLLHPQIDDGGTRPDNVEYPWSGLRSGEPAILTPATERFRLSERLFNNSGRQMIKAATMLTRRPHLVGENPAPRRA